MFLINVIEYTQSSAMLLTLSCDSIPPILFYIEYIGGISKDFLCAVGARHHK